MAKSRFILLLLVSVLGASLTLTGSASTGGGNSDFAHLCQQGGWKTLMRADGTPFANNGACVSYGAKGALLGQTISFTSTNPSPVTALDPGYTPTATATSGLAVAITLDATSTGCSLAAGVVSFPASGTCVIDANQAGNGTWAAAAQKQQTIMINKKAQTISFTSTNPSPVTALDPGYTPTATATSGLAVAITLDATSTGCTLAAGVVSFPASGTCVIDANQVGNGTWAAAAQKQQTIVINKKPQTISFTSTAPSPVTATYTPTATSTSGLPVAITLDATSTGCTLTAGVVSFPGSGTCVIDANQAGNGTWAAAAQKQQAFAIVLQFVANGPAVPGLSGANENPAKTPAGTGSGTVTWDTATNMMTVVMTFTGLTSGTTSAHIHCCVTVAGGTAGVATTTPTFTGFPSGVTSGTYSHTFDMLAATSYNPTFVTNNGGTPATAAAVLLAGMRAGQTYLNVHTTINGGGEIRGFLGP